MTFVRIVAFVLISLGAAGLAQLAASYEAAGLALWFGTISVVTLLGAMVDFLIGGE